VPEVRKEFSFDSYVHNSSEESSFGESWTGEGKTSVGVSPTRGSPTIEARKTPELNVVFVRPPIEAAAASVLSI